MPTDRELLKRTQSNLCAGSREFAADPMDEVAKSHRRTVVIHKLAADPAAADATANGVANGTFWIQSYLPHKAKLVGVKILPQAALTSHNSNLATVNVTKDNGGGGAQTVIFSANTATSAAGGTGNWAAGVLINRDNGIVTASDANVCDAGSYLQIQVAKGASGVAVPVCAVHLTFEEV